MTFYMRRMFLASVGIISIVWGIQHLFPSKNIILKYDKLIFDNVHLAHKEWIIESFIMISLGLIIVGISIINIKKNHLSKSFQIISSIVLAGLLLFSLYSYPF